MPGSPRQETPDKVGNTSPIKVPNESKQEAIQFDSNNKNQQDIEGTTGNSPDWADGSDGENEKPLFEV